MYRCEVCQEVAPPNTPLNRVHAEVRMTTYPFRRKANPVRIPGKKHPKLVDDPGGEGFEIVSELKACPSCFAKIQTLPAEEILELAEAA